MRMVRIELMIIMTFVGIAAAQRPIRTPADREYLEAQAEADRLHREVKALEDQAKQIGGGSTVADSITKIKNRQNVMLTDILIIEESATNAGARTDELHAIRQDVEDVWNRKTPRETSDAVGDVVREILKKVPQTLVGRIAVWLANRTEDGYRYINREMDMAAIDESIRNNTINTGDLYVLLRALHMKLTAERQKEREVLELQRRISEIVERAARAQRRADRLKARASSLGRTDRDMGDIPLLGIVGIWEFRITNPDGSTVDGHIIIQPEPRYTGVFVPGNSSNMISNPKLEGNKFTATPDNQQIQMTVKAGSSEMQGTWTDGWSRFSGPLPAVLKRVTTNAQAMNVTRLGKNLVAVDFMGRFLPTDPRIHGKGLVEAEGSMTISRFFQLPNSELMRVEFQHDDAEESGRKFVYLNGSRIPWNFER